MDEKFHYECLGCHKPYNTYKYYPDGWICLNCRDSTKITVKCSECKSDVKVTWDTYRMKDPNTPWRCRACNDKYRNDLYNSKSPEEKQKFVESQISRTKAWYENRSEEEKIKDSERRKTLWNKRKLDGDFHIIEAMKDGRKLWWESLTPEQKKEQWSYMNDGRSKWWNSLTTEEKNAHMKYPHEGFKSWFKHLTPEEQMAFMTPILTACQKFWDNMDADSYQEWRIKHMNGYKEYIENISRYGSPIYTPNKNELAFINELNNNHIPYIFQYPNTTIHPDFNKLFPSNPVTGANFVDPTHMWDFLVRTVNEDILVDIDGSMHFKDTYTKIHPYTGIEYKELDYKKFKDSIRPYQTDGLNAYAILCYDDNITHDTEVINVNSGEKMSFDNFMAIVIWLNMNEKDRQEVLQYIYQDSKV